jgi:hypothetical protein
MMLTARLDTQMANQAVSDGTMSKLVNGAMDRLKPEAAYFSTVDGDRCCTMVFDMADSTKMPPAIEPFFHAGAKVEVHPVMNIDDLRTGLANLQK